MSKFTVKLEKYDSRLAYRTLLGTSANFPRNNSKTKIWRTNQSRGDGRNSEQVAEEKRDAEMEHNIKQEEDSEDQEGDIEQEHFTDDEAPAPVLIPDRLPLGNTPTNSKGEWGFTREDIFLAGVAARKPAKRARARAAKNYAKAKRAGFASHMNRTGSVHSAETVSPSVLHNLKRSRLEDEAEEQEPKKKSKNPPGYRASRYKRMAEEIEAGIKDRPYSQRELSELALTAPESDGDTSRRFGLSLSRVKTPSTDSVDQKTGSPTSTLYQGKEKIGRGLDDATKKMLMDTGIGIANPVCRCPCHRGDSHNHAVQECHCMSKEALARKYLEENLML